MDGDLDMQSVPDAEPLQGRKLVRGGSNAEPPAQRARTDGGGASIGEIAALLQKELRPVNATMEKLENQMSTLTIAVDEKFKSIETKMNLQDIRVAKLEELFAGGTVSKNDGKLESEIEKLKVEMNAMKSKPNTDVQDDQTCTAVFGGFSSFESIEETEKWLSEKLWSEWLPIPGNVFCKGEFKGIFYAKFGSTADRDSAVNWFRKSSIKIEGHPVWSKPDLPLHKRIIKSLLFGTKYICDKALWVEEEKGIVTLNKKEILRACIRDGLLEIEYGEGWDVYLHDKDYPEFKTMVTALREKLANGGKEGKGKGKFGGKFKGKFENE